MLLTSMFLPILCVYGMVGAWIHGVVIRSAILAMCSIQTLWYLPCYIGHIYCLSAYGLWLFTSQQHYICLHIPINTMDNLVINLSDHRLSPDLISILSKGLNFCPTPGEPRPGDLLASLHRRLRRHSHFKDEEDFLPPEGGNFYSLDEF